MKPGVLDAGIILYDYLFCLGGAEKVTVDLAGGLGADICCAFRNEDAFPQSRLGNLRCIELLKGALRNRLHLFWYMGLFRTKTQFLRQYAWVIYSGSCAPMAVYQRPFGGNIYYCHTLPRFAYDLFDYFLNSLPALHRLLFPTVVSIVRFFYARALARMDVIVANSANVQLRLQRYLGIEARVIHPPCDVGGYQWRGQGDYFLSTARLEPLKRVETLVQAFMEMPDKKLVVASGGSEFARLRQLALGAENISFTGWLDDEAMRELVGKAIATIYIPRDEDFGMSPVESMAAGKPVIGVAEGGLLETVLDGETGILLPAQPSVDDVRQAVRTMTPDMAMTMRAACVQQAQKFSKERFLTSMAELVQSHALPLP